jgi:hypothetical protein
MTHTRNSFLPDIDPSIAMAQVAQHAAARQWRMHEALGEKPAKQRVSLRSLLAGRVARLLGLSIDPRTFGEAESPMPVPASMRIGL